MVSQKTENDIWVPVDGRSGGAEMNDIYSSVAFSKGTAVCLLLMITFTGFVSLQPDAFNGEGDIISTGPSRDVDLNNSQVPLGILLPDLDPKYVILCPEEFKEEVLPLAVHRTRMGLPSRVYTFESIEGNFSGADREQKVHNFLRALHRNFTSFKWLLIMGDAEHLMPRPLWHYAFDRGQPFGNYYHSDIYYAGLDSDWDDDGDGRFGEFSVSGELEGDLDWDIYVGRVPASNGEHAENYVSKLLRYEKNPPIGSWMERHLSWGSLMEPPNRDYDPYRYYDYKSNAYKVVKEVEANLPDHLEVRGLYDYPQLSGGNYTVGDGRDTLDRSHMLSEFNMGASMINFVGQARYEAYALNDYGPPTGNGEDYDWNEPMRYSDHELFENGDMMPFMYASTCDTAKFFDMGYYNDRSLETWLTSGTGGIIGLISSTGTSARGEEGTSSWGNWYLDREFWKLFLDEGETRPGRALFILKDRYEDKWLSPSLQIKETILGMIYTYILLGDPYVDIYTEEASRFMLKTSLRQTFFTGEHMVRFQVLDRDLVPVPNPRITIYNDRIYTTLSGDSNGWVNQTLYLGDSTEINITFDRHNMVPSFYRYPVEPAISDISISGLYHVEPEDPVPGEELTINVDVENIGGMTATSCVMYVTMEGGNGDPTYPYASVYLGDVPAGSKIGTGWNWTMRPGNHSFRVYVDSVSAEIDRFNNELLVTFDTPGPDLTFQPGSGVIRPTNIASPGAPVGMDFRILNLGDAPGELSIQVFLGDPEMNGSALSEPVFGGPIAVGGWWNGTIPIETPAGTNLLYLQMDVDDRYPDDMTDEPVKSLLEINLPPRWRQAPGLAMVEDSEGVRVRIDDLFEDPDNTTEQLRVRISSSVNVSCRIESGEGGEIYLRCVPVPDWYGRELLELEVTDGLSTSTILVNVTVAPVNDPPRALDAVQGMIELSLLEDSPFTFKIRASDIEGDPVTFHHPEGLFEINSTTGVIRWTPGQQDTGTMDLIVEIRDAGGGVTPLILRITVIEVNDPPVLKPIPDRLSQVGNVSRFRLEVEDEEGDTLEFASNSSLIRIDPDGWVQVNASSSFIGHHHIRISVSDGLNTVYVTFNLTVEGDVDDNETADGSTIQYILGGIGVSLAVIALLFMGLVILRRGQSEEWVEEELEMADELYEDDLMSVEDGSDEDPDLTEE